MGRRKTPPMPTASSSSPPSPASSPSSTITTPANKTSTTTAAARPRSRSSGTTSPKAPGSPRPLAIIPHPHEVSSIPRLLQPVLAIVFSLVLASGLNTVAAQFTGPSLSTVARSRDSPSEIGLIVGWRVLEIGLAWIFQLDCFDVASLTLLTHLPHFYLLHSYYNVDSLPLATNLATNIVSNSVPFYFLRGRNTHNISVPTDISTALATIILASALYALPLLVSLTTWLPTSLAVHFEGIATLLPAREASFAGLLTTIPVLLLGYQAYRFIFVSVVNASPAVTSTGAPATTAANEEVRPFIPEDATLLETLHYNLFWPLYKPARQQIFIARTAVLVAWTGANTLFLANATVEGCDVEGSARWAALWASAAALSGGAMGWVAGAF